MCRHTHREHKPRSTRYLNTYAYSKTIEYFFIVFIFNIIEIIPSIKYYFKV